jgi:hypothetical protein
MKKEKNIILDLENDIIVLIVGASFYLSPGLKTIMNLNIFLW